MDAAPAAMVRLDGGEFAMGTSPEQVARALRVHDIGRHDLLAAEEPRHRVRLSPFSIDTTPVTNRQFHRFVTARPAWRADRIADQLHNGSYLQHWDGHAFPPELADHPVVFVSWYAAMAYASWAGGRLPSEAEWEYAGRGGLRAAEFPWGDEPADPTRANYAGSGLGTTTAVRSCPPNAYGLYDLAGNVWEYCLDEWDPDFYARGPATDPVAGAGAGPGVDAALVTTRRVIRGGSWGGAPVNLRVAFRDSHPPRGCGPHVGFRCVRAHG